jgi:hypothetical protein
MNEAPAATRLFVEIGNPNGEIELLALLVGARHTLNAVAVGEVAVGNHVKIGQFDGDRAVEAAEKGLPILAIGSSADILPRRG